MAEETKNTYRYIDTDMDRDLLVKNLNHNVQDYVKHKGWDSSKASEFYDALDTYINALNEGRLSTSRSGSLLDSAGILDNGSANWRDKNGNVISQTDYDAMKKRKKKNLTNDFYSHREVAGYFNTIAKALYDAKYNLDKQKKEGEKPAEKFDLGTHGLWSKFLRSLNPNGKPDLQTWLNMDEWDPKKKVRPTTERAKYLGNFIDTYINKLSENQDYSNYDFTRQEYIDMAKKLQKELADGATDVDFRLLNSLGADPESYRTYFSTNEKATGEQSTQQKPGELSDEDRKALNTIGKQYRDNYNQNANDKYKVFTGNQVVIPIDSSAKTSEEKAESYKKNLSDKAPNLSFNTTDFKNKSAEDYGPYLQQYDEYNEEAFSDINNGQYTGWRYLPGSLNFKDYTVLGYNPENGQARRLFYGDIDRIGYTSRILSNYQDEQLAKKPFFQEGGQSDASMVLYKNSVNAINKFAKEKKESSEKTKADQKLRQPWKEGTEYNENKFTNTDIARLGSVAADIAALVDPEPFSALALGVASDVANLASDLKEGYGFWNSLGNFGANIGLSAVGMIPIFGDALGSGGKVVKTLMKMAPKINKVLLASGAIAAATNSDELIKSWKKIGESGVENEMTVEDWRNIATVIQLALGGANAVKNAKTVSKLRAKGKTDMLDVVCKDKATGEKKVFRFGDKEDIEALKNAKTTEDVNKVINGHNSLKDKYEVATQEGESVTYFGENSKWYKPWTWKSTTKTSNLHPDAIQEAIDYNKIRATAKKGTLSRSEYIARHGTPGYNPERTPEIITRGNRATAATTNRAGQRALPGPKERLGLPTPEMVAGYTMGDPYEIVIRHRNGTIERIPGYEYHNNNPRQPITPSTVAAQATIPSRQAALDYNPGSNLQPINNFITPRQEMQFRLNAATPTTSERSLLGEGTRSASHQRIGDLVRAAKNYKQRLGSSFNPNTTPHSTYGNNLIQRGMPENYLLNIGVWMQGGKLIRKGQAGLDTVNFTSGVPSSTLEVPQYKPKSEWELNNGVKPRARNYGEGYTTNLDYSNKEYGVTGPVNLSAIQKANADKRDMKNLKPVHGAEEYDYTNAQLNTDKARAIWQSNPNNRTNDFKSWAADWYASHPNGTQAQMLAAYNKAIDDMYEYKHEMGTEAYSGENSYRYGDEVAKFNKTNKAIYGSANGQNGVHGYSTDQEAWNGTTTAQRFIDITDNDIDNLNFNFTNADSEDFRNLFKGLVKDTTGRYYVREDNESLYQPDINTPNLNLNWNVPGLITQTNPPKDTENNAEEDGKSSKLGNLTGAFSDMLPEALTTGRYLAARDLNKRLLNIAHDMPVMLYQPMEAQRWIRGNQNAIQQGYQAAGALGHFASQPMTANGAEQTATMLEALNKGNAAIGQGYAQNDQAVNTSTEANWNQARANQQSRYNVATKNMENLFSKRVNYLKALGQYHRANYESLNSLLGQYETDLGTRRDELSTYRDALQEASLKNTIMGNLSEYGISQSQSDQDLVNQLMSGLIQPSELTEEQKSQWAKLSNSINEELTKRLAASKGLSYTPFTPLTPVTTPHTYSILTEKHGGVLPAESEKITIQKLKGSIQKMLVRQKHFEARLNAFEKDMDRSYKSASEYIKGQKKSK